MQYEMIKNNVIVPQIECPVSSKRIHTTMPQYVYIRIVFPLFALNS